MKRIMNVMGIINSVCALPIFIIGLFVLYSGTTSTLFLDNGTVINNDVIGLTLCIIGFINLFITLTWIIYKLRS